MADFTDKGCTSGEACFGRDLHFSLWEFVTSLFRFFYFSSSDNLCLSRNLFTSAKLSNLLALKFFILFPYITFYFCKIIRFCKIYFCKAYHSIPNVSNLSLFFFFVVSPANSLLILLIFKKKNTLILLIFCIVFILHPIYLHLKFLLFFLLFALFHLLF